MTGCSSGLQFNTEPMTPGQMLGRAALVFVGTIERQSFISWPFLRIPGQDATYWRVLDRTVRIEAILKGQEDRKLIDVYELSWVPGFLGEGYIDPGGALGPWRRLKLLRGFLRHPDPRLREEACRYLSAGGFAQDECRTLPGAYYDGLEPSLDWLRNRHWESKLARQYWAWSFAEKTRPRGKDELKLFTTINDQKLRQEFCRLFQHEFPNDRDNGCPAGQPPPATIVTVNGDVPLLGEWPAATP